jgi:hypothetical protein
MKKEFWIIFLMQCLFVLTLWVFGVTFVYAEFPTDTPPSYTVDGAVMPVSPSGAVSLAWTWYAIDTTPSITADSYFAFFSNSTAANAWRSALIAAGATTHSWTIGYSGWSELGSVRFEVSSLHYHQYKAFYTSNPALYTAIPSPDTDNDGIDDRIDPFPEEDIPFTWKRTNYCTDSSDEIVWFQVRAETLDGSDYTYMGFGDDSSCVNHFVDLSTPWRDGDLLPNFFGSGGEYASFSDEDATYSSGTDKQIEGFTPGEGTGFTTGDDGSGNSTDSERLDSIVGNTKAIADNIAREGDYLKAIGDQLASMDSQIADLRQISGGSSAVGSGGDNTDVISEMQSQESAAETEADNQSGSLTGEGTDAGDYDGTYTSEDAEEEDTLTNRFTSLFADNPLTTWINGTYIETTGSECSFEISLMGQTMELDFCAYEWVFTFIGNVLYGLSGLKSLFILLGK